MPGSEPVAAAVRAMVEAVNRGDMDAALAAFADNATIVEDIAPFRWQGPSAASDWLKAMAANAKRLGVEAIDLRLGAPMRIAVEGDGAYAVFPGRLTLTSGQMQLVADGGLTFTLRRSGDTWRIDCLTWSGSEPAPAAERR
jgi:ketosteroid isomerase-like protein